MFRPDLVDVWVFRIGPDGRPEILLMRRSPGRILAGLWQGVSGSLEPGERIAAGALRELREETGFAGPAIEAFFDLDQVNQFHEPSVDAIVSAAVFAVRVGPGRRGRPVGRARRRPLGHARRGARPRRLAGLPRVDRPDRARPARPAPGALVPARAGRGADGRLSRNLPRLADGGRAPLGGQLAPAHGVPAMTTPIDAAQRRIFRSKVDTIRPTYGFEDVSLAPGTSTVEPNDVDLGQVFCGIPLGVPILASAMDAVVDVRLAGELARLGGLAILNLEGVQARYDDPDAVLARIAAAPDGEVQDLLAEAYTAPIREELIVRRIEQIHAVGSQAAVAATPGAARRFGPFSAEHGADLFLVQSQVSSARHLATGYDPLSLEEFTRFMPIPVAVGNTTNAEAAFALMEQGAAAVFVGVGPGAACTTREVLGIGVPQVSAISDVAAARDAYLAETGRYVPVVADGGMRRGGELAKAIAAGADVLMIGSPLARAEEAPGRGTNWGMAAPSPTLPRGTRIRVGTVGSLERILFGPAHVTDGSENLVGALRQSMAALGARTIREMQAVEMVYAPSVQTEGKSWQRAR